MLAVTGKLQVATQASVQRLLDVLLDQFLGEDVTKPSRKPRSARPKWGHS
jgi:hypothetical protein